MASTILTLCSMVLVTHHVVAYPIGAPVDTCMTMFPKHNGIGTQLEQGRYNVIVDSDTYTPNQPVKVTVSASDPNSHEIRGFQLRARRTVVNPEDILGTFSMLEPAGKLKTIGCHWKKNNMVTHNNSLPVGEVSASWTIDENVGPIIFDVTVVESFSVFYFGLKSSILTPATNSGPVIQPPIIASEVSSVVATIDWDKCGDTKGCLMYPRYCSGDDCKVAVSFSLDKASDTATFEMMAKSNGYVALGFSNDMTMGDDQTISCASVYDRVTIQNGFNHPFKYNDRLLGTNLTNLEAAMSTDGKIYCRFTRPIYMQLIINYEEHEPLTPVLLPFDLNNEFYLFVAWGHTYELTDILGYHNEMPVMSETKVDFSDKSTYRGSIMPKLVRAHASLMAVAWMGFAGLAIVLARYYKDGFNDKKICGIKIWFHVHRASAILTFVLTVLGLIMVLVELDGKITENASAHTHMCLGFTVVSLVCAQLLGGLLRPGPEGKARPWFNFFHKLLGTAALVIAAATLIYAFKIGDFCYDAQQFGEKTVAVWAGIFVFMEVVLTGYEYFAPKLMVHRSRSDEYNLDKDGNETDPTQKAAPSHFLLAIFILFIICSIIAALCMTLFF